MTTVRQLEVFNGIVQTGNVTAAASLLGISQPAASQAIKELESLLGFKLFRRGGRGLNLTESGALFHIEAEKVLLSLRDMNQQAESIRAGNEGRLTIGCETAWGTDVMTPVVTKFLKKWPRVSLSIYPMVAAHLQAWMSNGIIDVAILSQPLNDQNFLREVLVHTSAAVILPASHPLASKEVINAEDTRGEKFVILSSQSEAGYHQTATVYASLNIERRVLVFSPLTESVFALVEAGVGISILSHLVADCFSHKYNVVCREFLPETHYKVYGYRRRGVDGSPLASAFLELFRHELLVDAKARRLSAGSTSDGSAGI